MYCVLTSSVHMFPDDTLNFLQYFRNKVKNRVKKRDDHHRLQQVMGAKSRCEDSLSFLLFFPIISPFKTIEARCLTMKIKFRNFLDARMTIILCGGSVLCPC